MQKKTKKYYSFLCLFGENLSNKMGANTFTLKHKIRNNIWALKAHNFVEKNNTYFASVKKS